MRGPNMYGLQPFPSERNNQTKIINNTQRKSPTIPKMK